MPAKAKTALALLLLLLLVIWLVALPTTVEGHKSSKKKKKKKTQKQVFERASGGVDDSNKLVSLVVPSLANTSYWMPEQCRRRVNGSVVEVRGLNGEVFDADTFPRLTKDGYACSVEIIRHGSLLADSFCMVETANCTLQSTAKAKMQLPNIPKGSWGTCALIAPGSSVLGAQQGPDIDSHDTVIRIQAQNMDPKFEMDIGQRTDILITRGKINYSYKKKVDEKYRYGDKLKYLLGKKDYYGRFKDIPLLPYYFNDLPPVIPQDSSKFNLYKKWSLKSCKDVAGAMGAAGVRNMNKLIYQTVVAHNGSKASNGMKFFHQLAWSRLCTRLDIYGFSFTHHGTGSVYDKSHSVVWKHHMDVEGWYSRHLMKHYGDELGVCVYL